MIKWATLLNTIRNSVLRDNQEDMELHEWKDQDLLAYCRWALVDLCQHTANPIELFINAESRDSKGALYDLSKAVHFYLPKHPYGVFTKTSSVAILKGNSIVHLDPNHTMQYGLQNSYYMFHPQVLNLSSPVGESSTLAIRYFSYFDAPTSLEDEINVPEWMESALIYRIALYAMTNSSVENAGIMQWSLQGNREQSPIREYQLVLMKLYEDILSRHEPQNRNMGIRK